jgi:hypothetical protein
MVQRAKETVVATATAATEKAGELLQVRSCSNPFCRGLRMVCTVTPHG